tara:strand:- start:307 stop:888 length:582 start_codon:yes stop_codon:yes gene_type:complete
MPKPGTMRVVKKETDNGPVFSMEIEIDEREFDLLSIIGYRQELQLWAPWQETLSQMGNEPDNIELLERKMEERAELLAKLHARTGEKIKNNEHYIIVMQAYEEAGENGLTGEELIDRCIEIQAKGRVTEAIRKGWPNRARSIHGDFRTCGIVIKANRKRSTASSRARAAITGDEPSLTAEVWVKKNLGINDSV